MFGSALLSEGFWELVDALGTDAAATAPNPSTAPGWLRRVRDELHDCAGAAPRVRDQLMETEP